MSNKQNEQLEAIVAGVKERLPNAITSEATPYGDTVLMVKRNQCHDVMKELRGEGFNLLLDIAGVDLLNVEHKNRFELVYNLYSLSTDLRLRVKISVPEDDMNVPSMTDIWQSANWAEREAYDMFGFKFEGHPNLVRILCHSEFEGHALRKDYPVMKGQWATKTADLEPELDRE